MKNKNTERQNSLSSGPLSASVRHQTKIVGKKRGLKPIYVKFQLDHNGFRWFAKKMPIGYNKKDPTNLQTELQCRDKKERLIKKRE